MSGNRRISWTRSSVLTLACGDDFTRSGCFERNSVMAGCFLGIVEGVRKMKGDAMAVKADYCDGSASSPSTNRGTKASLDSGPQNRGIHRKPEDDQIKPPAHLSAIRGG